MDPDDRVAKKIREARMLRTVSPDRSLDMLVSLNAFARELHAIGSRPRH